MTINRVSHITVYVEDQQAACDWYVNNLDFDIVMDNSAVLPGMRWLTVSPKNNPDTQLVLHPAHSSDEKSRIGKNLMTVLSSDDCKADMKKLEASGVEIVDAASEVPWGISGIIRDLYGNPYNLVGPK
ncbi:MAG: VOC family protein [Proteobacteria bacterium]|nr:VOC family protein [Pseudomonadota bacterium]